jgi:hypothetical protein
MSDVGTELTLHEQQGAVQLLLDLEDAGAITLTSLTLTDTEMEYDSFESVGAFLGWIKAWSSWAIGDWLNFGEGVYGERWAQAAGKTRLSPDTLQHYQFVCRQIPETRRRPELSFSVHAVVARLDPKEQTYWLKKAVQKDWGEKELRQAIAAKRAETHPPLIPADEDTRPDIIEVARAILRDVIAHPEDSSLMIIPRDDIARLEAAVEGV